MQTGYVWNIVVIDFGILLYLPLLVPSLLFCTLFVLDARVLMVSHREVAGRRYAKPPHGSFTPTAVLTEPPPLREPCDE